MSAHLQNDNIVAYDNPLPGALRRLADRWARVLTRDLQPEAPHRYPRVHREVLAFVLCMFRLKLQRSGNPVRHVEHPTDLLDRASRQVRRLLTSSSSTRPANVAADHEHRPPPAPTETILAHGSADGVIRFHDFEITPEMFARFCRLTGMHETSLETGGENLAGLVFYIVVFSALTADGDPTHLQMDRLLKQLRACREHVSRQVDRWLDQRPGRSSRPHAPQGGIRNP